MATYTASAVKTSKNGNSWSDTEKASTGRYYGDDSVDTTSRIGYIGFSFDLSYKTISEIKFTFTFGGSGLGNDASKTICFYKYIDGDTATACVGESLGQLSSTGMFSGSKVFTFNSSTNTTLFNNLKSYFESGSSKLVIKAPSDDTKLDAYIFTKNYQSITDASADITYTDRKYTITYNANGGTGAPSSQTKNHGADVILSTTKPTYTSTSSNFVTYYVDGSVYDGSVMHKQVLTRVFTEWNTSKDGSGTSYNSGARYTENSNITLYAQYDEGTTAYDSSELKVAPLKTGYRFDGWYDAQSGGNKIGNAGDTYTPKTSINLYAHWTPYKLTVIYNANSGSFTATDYKGTTYTQTGNYDEKFGNGTLFNTTSFGAKRVGYHVYTGCEWNTKVDGTGTNFNHNTNYGDTTQAFAESLGLDLTTGDKSITLYVNWKINTYTVTIENAEVEQQQFSITHGSLGQLYGTLGTRTGYTFTNFTTSAGIISDNAFITVNDDLENGTGITVTGHWRVNKGIIYFHANGGNAVITQHQHTIDSNGLSSLTQTFTYDNPNLKVYETTSLFEKPYNYVKYHATAWLIGEPTYNSNGDLTSHQWFANGSETEPKSWEEYQDFINQHLTLDGVTATDDNSQELNLSGYVANGDCELHLYVNWIPTYIEIVYWLNGPDYKKIRTSTYKYSATEWANISDLEEIWEGVESEYAIGYHVNSDNCWLDSEKRKVVPLMGSTAANIAATLRDEGILDAGIESWPKTLGLVINWDINEYKIVYNSNGGSSVSSTTAIYNTPTAISYTTPTKDGYTFNGWRIDDNSITTVYQPGGTITIQYPTEQDVVLIALWTSDEVEPDTVSSGWFIKVKGSWRPCVSYMKVNGVYQ